MIHVTIEGIAAGGEGVGHLPDGRAVFVSRSAPGDELSVAIRDDKPRFARARVIDVLTASSRRSAPQCPHFEGDGCGGCQLQHLRYQAQLEAKQRIVGDALRRIARRPVPDPDIVPSPQEWRYRSRITLAARAGTGAGAPPVMGLHVEGDPDRVFPLRDCRITAQPLMALWTGLRHLGHLLPPGLSGIALRLDRDGGRHVVVLGGVPPWHAADLVAALADPALVVWWRPDGGAARVVGGPRSGYPALAFEQVNPSLGALVRDDAVAALGDVRDRLVWDLYGGVGDTARRLADQGARVWSVDLDRSAVEWARAQATGAGALPITYLVGRVEDTLRRLPAPDAVVVNPPRAGLHPRVCGRLEHGGPTRPVRLSYVSCDPATLARDLARLPSFREQQVRAYDLFPQTAHVETLVALSRP